MVRIQWWRSGGSKKNSGKRKSQRRMGSFESLESRALLSASTLTTLVAQSLASVVPEVTNTVPYGYTPAQIRHAYGFDQVNFTTSSGTVQGTGAGQTIAIVDAYNDPNIVADLSAFDSQFGLSAPPSLKVVNRERLLEPARDQRGLVDGDGPGRGVVPWVAPGANILLVEANSSSLNDLLTAVNYARQQPGVTTVSMSWATSEFFGETAYDSYFTTPSGHVGVTFLAATGDRRRQRGWPAVSPNVVAVGGTTLSLSSSHTRSSETAWSDSSGGVSRYVSEPSYQKSVQSTGKRTTPDVAYDANPNTGFAVYDSVAYSGQSGWFCVGGTSAGAPQWAGLIAIADQGRALTGLGSLSSTDAAIYALPSSDFYDVTSGGNHGYRATTGYDEVTGRARRWPTWSSRTWSMATAADQPPGPSNVDRARCQTPSVLAAAVMARAWGISTWLPPRRWILPRPPRRPHWRPRPHDRFVRGPGGAGCADRAFGLARHGRPAGRNRTVFASGPPCPRTSGGDSLSAAWTEAATPISPTLADPGFTLTESGLPPLI